MQTLLAQTQALQLSNTPTKEEITAAASNADAVHVGAVYVHDRLPHPLLSTAGPKVIADTAAKNAHTLLMDTRRKLPLPK